MRNLNLFFYSLLFLFIVSCEGAYEEIVKQPVDTSKLDFNRGKKSVTKIINPYENSSKPAKKKSTLSLKGKG